MTMEKVGAMFYGKMVSFCYCKALETTSRFASYDILQHSKNTTENYSSNDITPFCLQELSLGKFHNVSPLIAIGTLGHTEKR